MNQAGLLVSDLARQPAIPIRSRGPLLLAVDLETLVKGERDDTALLTEGLRQRRHTSIVYAAPRRSLSSAKICIEVFHLPAADVVVADGGASVRATRQHAGLDVLDATIGARWPGAHEIRRRVEALGHLLNEVRWEDARRMSYFPRRGVSVEELRFSVEKVLADLDVDVRVSNGEQIDVLPQGTDVTTTVLRTLQALNADPSRVVVAGGFIEPRFFDNREYWGIATGDTPAPVRASLVHHTRVCITSVQGPRGVLDGLHALGFLSSQD